MNFFNQGIPLGRWFRISVVIHWTFLIYAAYQIYHSSEPLQEALFIGLLFATVLMHEFGHALSCRAVGGEAIHIVLWPLGGIAFVQPPPNPWAWLITTVCGPLVNAILWPAFWLISLYGLPQLARWIDPNSLIFGILWNVCLYMWYINKLLLLFNLIPAYPMDGGRMLQEVLWLIVGYPRSLMIAGMVGTAAGAGFVVLGLGLQSITIPVVDFTLGKGQNPMLVVIGIMCAMSSFGIYKRSQEIGSWRKR